MEGCQRHSVVRSAAACSAWALASDLKLASSIEAGILTRRLVADSQTYASGPRLVPASAIRVPSSIACPLKCILSAASLKAGLLGPLRVMQQPSLHSRSPSCLAGHLFCTECIQQAQLADRRCPVCRGQARPVRACPAAATAASGAAAAQCSGEGKPACLVAPEFVIFRVVA